MSFNLSSYWHRLDRNKEFGLLGKKLDSRVREIQRRGESSSPENLVLCPPARVTIGSQIQLMKVEKRLKTGEEWINRLASWNS